MRPCVPMHNPRALELFPGRGNASGGTRLATSVFETRSFFTNPS